MEHLKVFIAIIKQFHIQINHGLAVRVGGDRPFIPYEHNFLNYNKISNNNKIVVY